MASAFLFHFFICRAIIFLALFVSQGYGQCYGTVNLTLHQAWTHRYVGKKPEWKVTIKNNCYCSQMNVKVYCRGFRSKKAIDPSIFEPNGGDNECVLNTGLPIYPDSSIGFTYAWVKKYPFRFLSSTIACS